MTVVPWACRRDDLTEGNDESEGEECKWLRRNENAVCNIVWTLIRTPLTFRCAKGLSPLIKFLDKAEPVEA